MAGSHQNRIRPVLFLFYMVETLSNISVGHYYMTTHYYKSVVEVPWDDEIVYISYVVCFYIFTVLTLFASVNVCTRNEPSLMEEVLRPLAGAIIYTILTFMALYDTEADFHIIYRDKSEDDHLLPVKPMHPYFLLLRHQAKASLVCSVIFLLHSFIALDFMLSNDQQESDGSSDISGDIMNVDYEDVDFEPVQLYVLGSDVQRWLEKYKWFRDYISIGAEEI